MFVIVLRKAKKAEFGQYFYKKTALAVTAITTAPPAITTAPPAITTAPANF